MKEINKYYTPEIEEFYEGFEFEILGEVNQEPGWVKKTFEQGCFIICDPVNVDYYSNLQERIDAGDLRVKYLDEKDFIELGFQSVDSKVATLKTDSDKLHFQRINHEQFVIARNGYKMSYNNDPFKIKNKSELKRLLKHLNII